MIGSIHKYEVLRTAYVHIFNCCHYAVAVTENLKQVELQDKQRIWYRNTNIRRRRRKQSSKTDKEKVK